MFDLCPSTRIQRQTYYSIHSRFVMFMVMCSSLIIFSRFFNLHVSNLYAKGSLGSWMKYSLWTGVLWIKVQIYTSYLHKVENETVLCRQWSLLQILSVFYSSQLFLKTENLNSNGWQSKWLQQSIWSVGTCITFWNKKLEKLIEFNWSETITANRQNNWAKKEESQLLHVLKNIASIIGYMFYILLMSIQHYVFPPPIKLTATI